MTFQETHLNQKIKGAVKKAGFDELTPIQEKAIPAVLDGHDMIACAQTGTGKTAAFALPILHMLNGRTTKKPRALIMSPTRELAQQIFENFKKYGRYMKLRAACIYGGTSQHKQIEKLRQGYDILIATPGRLLDFVGQGIVTLDDIQIFVLDEADQMLDMGFIPDIREIASMIPAERQTLMFSATMPKEVEALARDLLRNPVDIRVAPQASPAETVDHRVCFVRLSDKNKLLKEYLEHDDVTRSIIFTKTKTGADKLVNELGEMGIKSLAIHGDKKQGQRRDTLQRFRTGQFDVLVATDVMARGIDVKNVSHVFNYDMPREPEDYIHRIGRSGRAGETGQAITLCSRGDRIMLKRIESLIRKEIPEEVNEWSVDFTQQEKLDEAERRKQRNAKRNARRDRKRAEAKADRLTRGHNRVELGNSVRNVRDEKTSKNKGYFVVSGRIVTGSDNSAATNFTNAKSATNPKSSASKRSGKNKRSEHSTKSAAKKQEFAHRSRKTNRNAKRRGK